MAVSHKGAISFGLVHIPVSLYTAATDNSISFNQLHKKCKSRIKYKKVCPVCDEEVSSDDIVKGYQYQKDSYVIMNDDDFEKIKTEKDKSINIIHFANKSEIKPVYYDKSYYVTPDAGGDKAYELLRYAMESENKIAIAKTVLGTKQTMLAIMPSKDSLVIETMFYYDEIKALPKSISKPSLNESEISMAKMLINNMTKTFEPELYHDEYQEKLKQAIEQKINGDEIVPAQTAQRRGVFDLMEALKLSLEEQNKDASSDNDEKKSAPKTKKRSKTIDFDKKNKEISAR